MAGTAAARYRTRRSRVTPGHTADSSATIATIDSHHHHCAQRTKPTCCRRILVSIAHVDAGSQARRSHVRHAAAPVQLPAFMPVGTQATVKGLEIEQFGRPAPK